MKHFIELGGSEHGSSEPPIKHEIVDFVSYRQISNYWPRLRLEQLNSIYTWLIELPENTRSSMGFGLRNNTLGLVPIDIKKYYYLLGRTLPKYLLHEGFQNSAHIFESQETKDIIPVFDNYKDLSENGVWGDPNTDAATFLKPPDSLVVPMARNGFGTRLFIDIERLQQLRSIFVDPEMYVPRHVKNFDGAEHDIPGNSLMVFGGIPKISIVRKEHLIIHELR